MMDDEPWFLPKRYGYGAGLPIAWQGWATIGLFIAGLIVAGAMTLPQDPIAFISAMVILIAALAIVAASKTRGGWRSRWGKED